MSERGNVMMKVMKRAWEIYRTLEGDHFAKLRMALQFAWKEVKRMAKKAFESFAKVTIPGREDYDSDSQALSFKLWEKNGMKRIYINDYKRRTIGFIENGCFNIKDNQGLTRTEIEGTVEKFFAEYAF